jgi:hypothetical protein
MDTATEVHDVLKVPSHCNITVAIHSDSAAKLVDGSPEVL